MTHRQARHLLFRTSLSMPPLVLMRRAIASRHPDFEMIDDTNGIILAGFRTVGRFTVEANAT